MHSTSEKPAMHCTAPNPNQNCLQCSEIEMEQCRRSSGTSSIRWWLLMAALRYMSWSKSSPSSRWWLWWRMLSRMQGCLNFHNPCQDAVKMMMQMWRCSECNQSLAARWNVPAPGATPLPPVGWKGEDFDDHDRLFCWYVCSINKKQVTRTDSKNLIRITRIQDDVLKEFPGLRITPDAAGGIILFSSLVST